MTRQEFDELAALARRRRDLTPLARRVLLDVVRLVTLGEALPPRPEWAEALGVSLRTLERALQELSRTGVVEARRIGRGAATYTVDLVDDAPISPLREVAADPANDVAVNRQTGITWRSTAKSESENPVAVNRQSGGRPPFDGGLKAQRESEPRVREGARSQVSNTNTTTNDTTADSVPPAYGALQGELFPGLSDVQFVAEHWRRTGRRLNPDLLPEFARWFELSATRDDVLYAFREAAMHSPRDLGAYVREVVFRRIAERLHQRAQEGADEAAPVIVLDHYRRAGGER